MKNPIPSLLVLAAALAVALPLRADQQVPVAGAAVAQQVSPATRTIEQVRQRVLTTLPEIDRDRDPHGNVTARDRMRQNARERLEQGTAAEHASLLLHMDVLMPLWREMRVVEQARKESEQSGDDSSVLGQVAEFRTLMNRHRESFDFWREELLRGRDQFPGQERWRDRQIVQLDRLERIGAEFDRVNDEQMLVLLAVRAEELSDALRWEAGVGRERTRDERITRLEDEIGRLEGHLQRLQAELNALRVEEEWEPALVAPPERPSPNRAVEPPRRGEYGPPGPQQGYRRGPN